MRSVIDYTKEQGPIPGRVHLIQKIAMAIILCLCIGKTYAQTSQRTTKSVQSIADTLQEGGKNIHFSDPIRIIPTAGIYTPYLPSPIIDSVNIDIRNKLGRNDIHIDFTDFDQYNGGEAIIREVTIHTGGHHYTVKIEGKGFYLGKSTDGDEYSNLLSFLGNITKETLDKVE